MSTTIVLEPPADFISMNDRCPACPLPDDRPECCHDGDLS